MMASGLATMIWPVAGSMENAPCTLPAVMVMLSSAGDSSWSATKIWPTTHGVSGSSDGSRISSTE